MNAAFTKQDRLPFLLICLYAATELIPGSNTADVMGTQWFYLSIINIISILYIAFGKDQLRSAAVQRIPRTALYIIYLFLFALVCGSAGWAINKIEALVGVARWVNMFILFYCAAVLLYGRLHLIKWLAGLLTVLLLVQCLMILSQFFKGVEGEAEIDKLIYSIKLNTGNKNILAAGLLMKIPFVFYFIYQSNSWKRILFAAILLPAALSVFILNARASYIGLLLELLCFVILLLIVQYRKNKFQDSILRISISTIPVIIAFFLSSQLIKSSASENDTSPYGTVTERLSSISLTASGSNSRL